MKTENGKWKTVKLGDIFDLQMGKTPDRKKLDYFQGSHKWISIADISKSEKYISETKEYLTDDAIASSGIKSIPKDTLIMSFKLSIGKTAITSDEMYSNEAIMAFLSNGKYETDNSFLYHLFSNKDWSEGSNKAVKGITLNKASLSEAKISLPPLETQKHIAAVLDKCTALIAKHKLMLEKYDTLIKSRFIEMFGDNPIENGKWKVEKLGNLGLCKNGMNFSYEDNGFEINCLGVGDFKDNAVISNCEKLPVISLNEKPSEEYLLKDNDIVFVRSNGNKELVGRSVLVHPHVLTTFSGFCIRFRLSTDSINHLFLLQFLKMPNTRKNMAGRGANIQNLNQQILSNLDIPVPPIELQNDFAAFVQQIDKSKFVVQKSLEKAETLYKSLMQTYFG